MHTRTSTLVSPRGIWWQPLGRDERIWLSITVFWALAMFVLMLFVWPVYGKQHVPEETYRIEPEEFRAQTQAFIDRYQTGEIDGVPVVKPPPGSEVFLEASTFRFRPVLELQKGETYKFLISSLDVQHGFSLQPDNINLQILPGYVMAVKMTPQETGEFAIICNEFCGPGHHLMTGRIFVNE